MKIKHLILITVLLICLFISKLFAQGKPSKEYAFKEETSVVQFLSLFPNPAANFIHINYTSNSLTNKINVSIYNTIGKTVRNFSLGQHEGGIYQQELNLTGFAPGVYFVQIKDGSQRLVKKFVKS